MLKQQFIQLIKTPQAAFDFKNEQLHELELLIKEYPFFQSAYLLYTKGLHTSNALNYSKQLRKTAIVASSRETLYELIHRKTIVNKASIHPEVVTEEITPVVNKLVIEPVAEKEESVTETEKSAKTSPVSITNDEIKIVYVTTVPSIQPITVKENPVIEEPAIAKVETPNNELNILKDVENETSSSTESVAEAVNLPIEEETSFATQIETEISRGIIQSYVETDILKTPELHKEKIEEPLTFTSWLEKVKKESASIQKIEPKVEKQESTPEKQTLNNTDFKQKKDIINKIIDLDPGRIKLGNQKFFTPQADAKQSLLENEHLVTETLAKIYALQGNNAKAIRAYEILSLKFPQKSVYFASLIEKLKTNK